MYQRYYNHRPGHVIVMQRFPSLLKPQFHGSRHVPFYSKLLFRNKILLIIVLLLLLFGLLGSFALHKILTHHFSKEYENQYRTITQTIGDRLAPMLLAGDTRGVRRHLHEERRLYQDLAYLIVTDSNGNSVAEVCNESPREKYRATLTDGDHEINKNSCVIPHNPIMEIVLPLGSEGEGLGTITAGVATRSMDALVNKIMTLYLGILAAIILVSFLIARHFLIYATKPIVTLTRIADEISLGNLDMDILFGKHVNCREIKKCRRTDCAAYTNAAIQCWFVDGTPCEGYEPKFPEKLKGCRNCEVYRTHKGDEIVQLADSFQHMIYMLKTSQEEIKSSHEFQRNLIQNSLIGIIAADEEGEIKIFNRVAENITEYNKAEVIGKATLDVFFSKEVSKMINRPLIFDYGLELRGFKPMESEIWNKRNEPIPVKLSGINLYEEGKHLGKVFSFQDMREVNRLRQDLIQSERLTATGQAVASISHAIKNILDGLVGGVHVYKMGSRKNDEKRIKNGWRMIEKNIDLISELVLNLLNYAKKRDPIFQKCDPRTIVEDIAGTMESKIREKNIELVTEYNGEFDNTYLDSYALHQCLMNLFSNAIDAIPSGRQGKIGLRIQSENEHGIIFEVSDNGVGMSEEMKKKAFQGMFSTKGSKGTGLGLLVIRKTISELGGTLDVDSEENKGTVFRIWIPHHSSLN